MLGNKSLLKITINKNNECVIKIDPSTYARLTDIERRIINCHSKQILEILKEKYEYKGSNVWRD